MTLDVRQARTRLRLRGPHFVSGLATLAALAASAAGAVWRPAVFFPAYMVGFLLAWQVSIGALGMLLIDHLIGGAWSRAVRRPLEAAAALMPLLAVLAVPLVVGAPWLFAWAGPHAAGDAVLRHQAPWFNMGFFVVRSVVCLGFWTWLAAALQSRSARCEAGGHEVRAAQAEAGTGLAELSAVGLVGYALTASVAAIDWGMALEPRWTSTIYPWMLVTGAMLAALALAIATGGWLERSGRNAPLPERTWQDLGAVLITLVMGWGYLAFSQYLIIWAADRPGENAWYVHREAAGWGIVALGIAAVHGFLPFLVLLSREAKRRVGVLLWVGAWLVAAHVLDAAWLVWPSFAAPGWKMVWLAVAAPAVPLGAWAWAYLGRLAARPVTPPPARAAVREARDA